MKISTLYSCSTCSYESSKWLGRCPQCEAWNSFSEKEIREVSSNQKSRQKRIQAHSRTPKEFSTLTAALGKESRNATGIDELDRVLGGGVVPGSVTLLTGEPGIGKSTLTLQIAEQLSQQGRKVLYISGEESEEQISLRGKRLNLPLKNLKLLSENNLETLLATAEQESCDFLIVDSVQVISSSGIPGGPGSVSQVRLCTEAIIEFAKPKRMAVLLIGHVTKDGTLAGPRVLEHLVDTVCMLEGDRFQEFRLLRNLKNRFGSASEVGVFEMTESGLTEVKNPSSKFMSNAPAVPGVALVCPMEGTRPFIVEVQALTSETRFGYPSRRANGFDINRLNVLLAVLERHCGANLSNQDVYVNVVSGIRLEDPACDLGVGMAVLSSLRKKPLPEKTVLLGEIGLTGEIRKIPHFEKRAKEIKKLGLAAFPEAKHESHRTPTLPEAAKFLLTPRLSA